MDRIIIVDTTLRDGEQAPGFSMNVEEKLKMARQLERLQVDVIEAGFPIASEGDFEAVKKIAAEIRSTTIAALARAVSPDIDRCLQALEGAAHPRIPTFLATSDIHLEYKLNNSLAAIENGARQVECAINGIGERAGNAALEEIVMALDTRKRYYNVTTGVKTQELYRSSQLLCQLTGKQVQVNKAIVGENAFAHEAGIHQDGMLKNAVTYEIMSPDHVGVPRSMIVLGKHSGRHALEARYRELGYALTREQLERAYVKFLEVADSKKRVEDQDLISIHESAHSVAAG